MAVTLEWYLVRHAIAAERGPDWPDDTRRPLTADGKRRFSAVVGRLNQADVALDLVLTSPLLRARETADLLRAGLGVRRRVLVLPVLEPGAAPRAVVASVLRQGIGRRIALVGHEPDLGGLAAWLIGASRPLPFRKGSICRIDGTAADLSDSNGTLVWFAPPRLLRRRH